MEKVLLFWSGGKDSTLAFHYLKKSTQYQITALVSTLDKKFNGIPFHGVKEVHLVNQAKMLNTPLQRIFLPSDCSNQLYEQTILSFLEKFKKAGINKVAFGDIHLEDIKKYRSELLSRIGMEAIFPLWGMSSKQVVDEFIELGHRACVTSLMKDKLPNHLLGHQFNKEFLDKLPSECDVAGENGEYHTFVSYGPYFKMRVPFSKGMGKDIGPYLVAKLQES